jgi:putative transposase
VFGEVVEDEVRLTPMGEIAKRCWEEIPKHFPNVELDEHVVMPNHIHGIIVLNDHSRDVELNRMNNLVGLNIFNPYQRLVAVSM